ncbi:Hypothetical predicted protein [Pelobates cultripes]|uniref:Uncharacterized protein n=1 Tax=Pelobates cultripes TaxID=61616 RepID=A0AAD1VVW6_PELCU|nr:Hypothetical predicted protein [Pelobates cultripes]
MLTNAISSSTNRPRTHNTMATRGSPRDRAVDKGIKLFPDLQQEFKLPYRLVFAYLQIKSYLAKNKPSRPSDEATMLMTEFEMVCTHRKPPKKIISISYKALTQAPDQGRETHIQTWHKELGKTITMEDWAKAYSSHKGVSSCATRIELQQKLLYRWYLVPARIHQIWPQPPDTC